MATFNFSMEEITNKNAFKENLLIEPWSVRFSAVSKPPEKFAHIVELIYDGETQPTSAHKVEFEKKVLQFNTDNLNQFLQIDIRVLLKDSKLSKIFKFVGVSCDAGHEDMIEHCQCISVDDSRTDLDLGKKFEIEDPAHVIMIFKMPEDKQPFSIFLLLDDLTDNSKSFVHMIDPGVGNGPPKTPGSGTSGSTNSRVNSSTDETITAPAE